MIVSNGLAEAVGWLEGIEGSSVEAGLVGFTGVVVAWGVHAAMSVKHSRMQNRRGEFFMVFSSQEHENYSATKFQITPSKVALNDSPCGIYSY